MEMTTWQKLQLYITSELNDVSLYKALTELAPTSKDSSILLDLAQDEQSHADAFSDLYCNITGAPYNPIPSATQLSGNYHEILRERVLNESNDFRKYDEQYNQTYNNAALKNAYYRARTDEAVHAFKLLHMLTK